MAATEAAENLGDEMSEVWSDTYNEGYINQFQPEPTYKIH